MSEDQEGEEDYEGEEEKEEDGGNFATNFTHYRRGEWGNDKSIAGYESERRCAVTNDNTTVDFRVVAPVFVLVLVVLLPFRCSEFQAAQGVVAVLFIPAVF